MVASALRDATGRGPRAIHVFRTDAVVTAVVYDSLTRMELTLLQNGGREMVIAARSAAVATQRGAMVEAIEQITGRAVRSLHSDFQPDEDVAVLVFVLA